jgi:phage-related protein
MGTAAHSIIPVFTQVMRQMARDGSLKLISQGLAAVIRGFATFIKNIAPAIPAAAAIFRHLGRVVGGVMGFIGDAIRIVTKVMSFNLPNAAKHGVHAVVASYHAFMHNVMSVFNRVKAFVVASWNRTWDDTIGKARRSVSGVMSVIRSLPGLVRGALANAGSWLVQAGRNVIQGLINGIRSMFGPVGSAVSSIVQSIRNFLPFSPAKVGPLSGSGSPEIAGRKIATMLGAGMMAGRGDVAMAAGHMVGGVSVPSGGAHGAGGRPVVVLEVTGSDSSIVSALAKSIRTKGGSPEILTRKVQFA